jgi:putative transposase
MCLNKNRYEDCISKDFLIPEFLWLDIQKVAEKLILKAPTGRPSIDLKCSINGIYFLLKTGIQWKALPRCFGSSSAIHRLFQKLIQLDFFKKLWAYELQKYDSLHGLDLSKQALDCAHRKSPLGCEKTGNSPVDRRKLGTKLSAVSDSKGIVIGLAIGSSNEHDSKLLLETLLSIPKSLNQPAYKEINLDSAYDSASCRVILFNFYYVPKIAPNKRRKKVKPPNPLGYSRWFIEPVHAWMNKFRAIFVRYCKYAKNYLSLAQFAVATLTFKKIRV